MRLTLLESKNPLNPMQRTPSLAEPKFQSLQLQSAKTHPVRQSCALICNHAHHRLSLGRSKKDNKSSSYSSCDSCTCPVNATESKATSKLGQRRKMLGFSLTHVSSLMLG